MLVLIPYSCPTALLETTSEPSDQGRIFAIAAFRFAVHSGEKTSSSGAAGVGAAVAADRRGFFVVCDISEFSTEE